MSNQNSTFIPLSYPVVTDDPKELIVRLYQYLNQMANAVNLKESGYYTLTEFVTGGLYFPNPALTSSQTQKAVYRPVFRLVVDFGALPNNTTSSVAHGLTIDSTYSFTHIYATASDPVNLLYFPIPTTGVTITVDDTNVNITTTSDLTAYTTCFVVLEYIKQ